MTTATRLLSCGGRARAGAGAVVTALVVAASVTATFAMLVASEGDARAADLRDLAGRLHEQWRAAGATVVDVPPKFLGLEQGAPGGQADAITIRLPTLPTQRCTSVALLGARGMSFHAHVGSAHAGDGDEDEDEDVAARSMSVGGLLALVRCSGAPIERITVTSDAGRGAIEVVVARSRAPLPPLGSVFSERTGGPLPPAPDPGALPPLASVARRTEVAEGRARADGAHVETRATFPAADDGSGAGEIRLAAGCHRLEVFGIDPRSRNPRRRFRLDVDALLRDSDDDRLLARDRTEAPDARLEACVGAPILGAIEFAGSPPREPVVVTHAAWAIPDRLPRIWGDPTRARMAAALLARHLPAPKHDPALLAEGAALVTPLFVALEPGACYVAVAAVTNGSPHGLGLRAFVGGQDSSDERGTNDDSGAVAFCARERDRARIEVDARGSPLAWGLALYRVETGVWGVLR